MMTRLLACCLALLFSQQPAWADAFPTHEFTLENGLKVILVEQHQVPAVSHTMFIHAGSSEDPLGHSGIAHYLEHLLFKGTEAMSEERYNQQIAALGGEHNAYTNQDVTGYYVLVSTKHLPEVMALESERFLNWKPNTETYKAERDVIMEERRMRTDNQPSSLLAEAMNNALFQHHPYRIPIIGWMHEMAQLTPEDAQNFFATYYQPKNATLLLVGDLTPQKAEALAEEYYGPWKNTRAVPKRAWASEPPHRAAITLQMLHGSVKQAMWRRYYEAPSLVYGHTEQSVPLMLLTDMLGADRTGILYKALVKTGKATGLDVGYYPFSLGPETFSVSMTPAPGVTPEALGAAYEAVLKKALASEGMTEAALERAKTQLKAETIFARDGLEGQAFILGQLVVLGQEPKLFAELPDMIDKVTLAQVKEAARAVLNDRTAVTGYLLPDPDAAPAQKAAPVSLQEDENVH